MDYIHYETQKELISQVKIVNKQPYVNTAIYRIELNDLKNNDMLSVSTEFEATQDNLYVVQIGSYVILSEYNDCSSGIIIANHNGFNITQEIHHGVAVHFRQFLLSEDLMGTRYLCTMIYPASLLAKDNDYLKIESNTGHLDVNIFKNTFDSKVN